jgi:hypothetical protein
MENIDVAIAAAERELTEAETFGDDALLVQKLDALASLLRAAKLRSLDAANCSARACVIRQRNSQLGKSAPKVQNGNEKKTMHEIETKRASAGETVLILLVLCIVVAAACGVGSAVVNAIHETGSTARYVIYGQR